MAGIEKNSTFFFIRRENFIIPQDTEKDLDTQWSSLKRIKGLEVGTYASIKADFTSLHII